MANHGNPLNPIITGLVSHRRRSLQMYIADGTLCPDERTALDELDALIAEASGLLAREMALEHYRRSGTVTDYTKKLFREAGLEVTPLRRSYESPNVISFPSNDANAG